MEFANAIEQSVVEKFRSSRQAAAVEGQKPATDPAAVTPEQKDDAASAPGGEEKKAAAPRFKAIAVDDGVIIGIGAYAENVDLDNEVVDKANLVKMAYEFCASADRTFKANHQEELGADLVASWPGAPILKSGRKLADGESLPDDDPVIGISLEKGAESAWFVAVRPHDPEVAKAAKAGEVVGFSWGATVTKEPME